MLYSQFEMYLNNIRVSYNYFFLNIILKEVKKVKSLNKTQCYDNKIDFTPTCIKISDKAIQVQKKSILLFISLYYFL